MINAQERNMVYVAYFYIENLLYIITNLGILINCALKKHSSFPYRPFPILVRILKLDLILQVADSSVKSRQYRAGRTLAVTIRCCLYTFAAWWAHKDRRGVW